jgi:hypothetical protein
MIFIEIYQDQTYFQRALDGNTFKITKLLFEKPTRYQSGQYEPLECHREVTFTIKTDTNDEENIHLDLGYMDYSTYRKTLNTDTEDKIVYLKRFVLCSDNDSIVYDGMNQNMNALENLEKDLLKRTDYIHQRIMKEIESSYKIQKIEEQFK